LALMAIPDEHRQVATHGARIGTAPGDGRPPSSVPGNAAPRSVRRKCLTGHLPGYEAESSSLRDGLPILTSPPELSMIQPVAEQASRGSISGSLKLLPAAAAAGVHRARRVPRGCRHPRHPLPTVGLVRPKATCTELANLSSRGRPPSRATRGEIARSIRSNAAGRLVPQVTLGPEKTIAAGCPVGTPADPPDDLLAWLCYHLRRRDHRRPLNRGCCSTTTAF